MIAPSSTGSARPARRARSSRSQPGEGQSARPRSARQPARAGKQPGSRTRSQPTRRAAARKAPRPAVTMALGLLWALALLAAAEAGAGAMALLLIPIGALAAVSTIRSEPVAKSAAPIHLRPEWPGTPPALIVAVTPAVLLPLAALAGAQVVVGLGALLVFGAVALLLATSGGGFPYRVFLAGFCPAIATASVVLALGQGLSEALTLLAAVCLYDMATFIMGNGPLGGPVGVISGWLSIGALALLVAAVVVPPYSGRNPWILLGLVAVLAPVGVVLCASIARGRRLPALRRLDSLVVAGPAWVVAVSLLLHR